LFEIRLPIVGHCARFYSLIRGGTRAGMQKVRAGDEKVQAELVFTICGMAIPCPI
jgi:hypothetical protein